jgi:serine/threonine protein kinase
VHRDLKPENLLYATNLEHSAHYNVIKVADFGLAKVLSGPEEQFPPNESYEMLNPVLHTLTVQGTVRVPTTPIASELNTRVVQGRMTTP